MKHILKCTNCGSYGLKEICDCGSARIEPKPPKFSPADKYGAYRRQAKEMQSGSEKKESEQIGLKQNRSG